MEIGDEIVQLLRLEGAGGGWHHVAAVEHGLADKAFVGWQTAGQECFLEQAFKAGAVFAGDGMRVVAGGAGLLVDVTAAGLLGVQPQLRVGLRRNVVAAATEECQKRERCKCADSSVHAAIIF